ncbi:MAG: GTPase [Myxococcota bacterium]
MGGGADLPLWTGRSGPVVVAPATAAGRGALAVVRLSGAPLDPVLDALIRPVRPGPWRPGRARRVVLFDAAGDYDDGVAVVRRGPRSYTGEDLCEVALHGNPVLVARLLDAAVDAGARIAAPGEFTRRAVLHGRMDLVRAEAVDQLIRATGAEGARIAHQAVAGALGTTYAALRDRLLDAAAELEARLDWADDDLALEDDAAVLARLADVAAEARALAATFAAGRALVDGVRIALVGPVNAGKSSLFNRLVGAERALVHEQPGTTRDVVEARAPCGPLAATWLDTAGERATDDPIEALGLALGRRLADDVDLLLVVVPAPAPEAAAEVLARTADRPRLVVHAQCDRAAPPPGALATSSRTGEGIDALRDAIVARFGAGEAHAATVASARQRDRLLAVAALCDEAAQALPLAGPAVAADAVTAAVAEIDAATGADPREAVLDRVFARFCIGK